MKSSIGLLALASLVVSFNPHADDFVIEEDLGLGHGSDHWGSGHGHREHGAGHPGGHWRSDVNRMNHRSDQWMSGHRHGDLHESRHHLGDHMRNHQDHYPGHLDGFGAGYGVGPYWDYGVEDGPLSWREKYPNCKGLKQSPVALPTKKENHTFIRRLGFYNYEFEHELGLQNNGHQIDLLVGKALNGKENAKCGGSVFKPKQYFHLDRIEFHWGSQNHLGSEHTVNGSSFPGEIQFVHYDKQYRNIEEASKVPGAIVIAVVLMKMGKEDNTNLNPLLENLHRINGTLKPVSIGVHDLEWLYPTDVTEVHECEFFLYEGSYTSPPCAEVVLWHIYRDRTAISERQLNHLRSVVSPKGRPLKDNYRPVQPLNDRKVWQFREAVQPSTAGSVGKAVFANFVKQSGLDDWAADHVNPHLPREPGMHNFLGRFHTEAHHQPRHHLSWEQHGVAQQDQIRNINDPSGFSYVKPHLGPVPFEDPAAGGYGR